MFKVKDHLDYKVQVLKDFGLTDRYAVREHLKAELTSAGIKTPEARITKIDNVARQMLDAFYNGDKTYVLFVKRETERR